MRVRMKVEVSGARNGQDWPKRGETIDVPDTEGADLCRAGMAEPVAEPPREERAVMPQERVETRDDDKPKRRGRPPLPRDEDGNIKRD